MVLTNCQYVYVKLLYKVSSQGFHFRVGGMVALREEWWLISSDTRL